MPSSIAPLLPPLRRLALEEDEFWLLAGVTERSFEEPSPGASRNRFAESVASYEALGAPRGVTTRLRRGISGLLEDDLSNSDLELVARNRRRGPGRDRPDFVIRTAPWTAPALVEVKLLYDCTLPKYLSSIAADVEKLERLRASGEHSAGLLAVYALTLPHHDYPAGTWYGHKSCGPRADFTRFLGVDVQRDALRAALGRAVHVSSVRRDLRADPRTAGLATTWFERSFRPERPWRFDAEERLAGAAVALHLWQV